MKKIMLFLSALLLLITIPASAQITITLGTYSGEAALNVLLSTSTTSNRYSRTISIYTDTDILAAGGVAGIISKLAWHKGGTGEYTTNDAYIKIYLKHITNDSWTTIPDWSTEITGATEVFTSSTYSLPTGNGWVEVPFTNTFNWNGTDNIAVLVEWDRASKPTADIKWGYSNRADANAVRVGSASLATLGPFHIKDKPPLLQLTFDPIVSCAAPDNLALVNASTNSAEISWNPSPDETNGYIYEVYYTGDTPGVDPTFDNGTVATGTTSVVLSGLSDFTAYDFYVATICANTTYSSYAGPLTFTTIEDCRPPSVVQVDNVSENSATLSWTASTNEVGGYEWRLFNEGDTPDIGNIVMDGNLPSGSTSLQLTSLADDTGYDFYIRALCVSLSSEFEGPINFKTDKLNTRSNTIAGLSLAPNPVNSVFNISAKVTLDKIEVYSIEGQMIKTIAIGSNRGQVDIATLPKGMYFVKVYSQNQTSNFKVLKN